MRGKLMRGKLGFVAALLCATFSTNLSVFAQSTYTATPDTLLVLKNGAEARGLFIEFKDSQYKMRLADGRIMIYAAADVDNMERISQLSSQTNPSASAIDPATCRVFITEKQIDKGLYTTIKDITVSKKWYGSTSEMFGELAEAAHKVGAQAVVGVHTWHSPSGFSWAAPHAGGMAVIFTESGRKALPTLEGRCY